VTDPDRPTHFTREPWWVVFVAAVVLGLMPLWKYFSVQRANTTGLSLPVLMAGFAALGAIAGAILVARSHVRSVFWSNVVLWLGILVAAIGIASVVAIP